MDRRSLEEAYMKVYSQPRPKLEYQGSDALLKRQARFVAGANWATSKSNTW